MKCHGNPEKMLSVDNVMGSITNRGWALVQLKLQYAPPAMEVGLVGNSALHLSLTIYTLDDQHLISLANYTAESIIMTTRMKKVITNLQSFDC